MRRLAFAALMAFGFAACSAATQKTGGGQRNVITAAEIQASMNATANAYDFIASARPHFLRDRGVGSFQNTAPVTAVVYLDGSMLGNLQTLKSISMSSVRQIEYMSGTDATTRYGMGHSAGVILVKTH